MKHWRDPNGDPKLHLFGQLKRITREWLDTRLLCKGGTYPAQLMYLSLADMACERITRGIVEKMKSAERPVRVLLDPYNPEGSTQHVNFNSSKETRWQTDARKCHINWVICDSDWEAEFCRIAEDQGHRLEHEPAGLAWRLCAVSTEARRPSLKTGPPMARVGAQECRILLRSTGAFGPGIRLAPERWTRRK